MMPDNRNWFRVELRVLVDVAAETRESALQLAELEVAPTVRKGYESVPVRHPELVAVEVLSVRPT